MIFLTKLGGKRFMLNEQLVESISHTPDTIVTMSNGHSYVVQESLDEVMNRIIAFNRLSKRRITRAESRVTEETQP